MNQSDAPLEEIVALSKKLIQIPTQTGIDTKTDKILSLTRDVLKDFKPHLFSQKKVQSLLFSNQDTKKFKIILNAHLDVVPGKPGQFVPHNEEGKLFGRGAYDMKAASAVMIILFKKIAQTLDYPLGLQIVTDEEMVSGLGTKVQLQEGITTDFALLGECGSNLDIIYENKGIIHAEITTSGATAHGAYPWKGENAITKMYEVIGKIQQQFPAPESETFQTTINISQIETPNKMWNQIPDKCTVTLDIRAGKEDFDNIGDKLKSFMPKDVVFNVINTRTPHYTDPNNKYIQLLNDAAKHAIDKKLHKRKTFGGSDATFFSEAGIDAIEFGPVGAGQHHDTEWVDIQSLNDYYQILKQFLLLVK